LIQQEKTLCQVVCMCLRADKSIRASDSAVSLNGALLQMHHNTKYSFKTKIPKSRGASSHYALTSADKVLVNVKKTLAALLLRGRNCVGVGVYRGWLW